MRSAIGSLLFAALLPCAWYAVYPNKPRLHAMARVVKRKAAPCSAPVTYSIGGIDPRFGLTANSISGEMKSAEAVWEGPSRRNLFQYKESGGDLTVSLVYEFRQAASDRLKAMGIRTDWGRASYEALKARYDALLARTDSDRTGNAARFAAYKRREAAFNAAMRRYNRDGGSAAERRRLEAGRTALEREAAGLRKLEAEVNAHVDTLNALATTLNQLIVQLNLNVAQYNRAGAALGSFEAGLYRMAWGMEAIDIYSYTDRPQLARLLAHELGHALGLDHLPDPEAVMYKMPGGTDLKAAAADLSELDKVCGHGFFRRR